MTNKTPEQIVAEAMSGGNRAYSTHDLQVGAVVAALREAGMLVEEWEYRRIDPLGGVRYSTFEEPPLLDLDWSMQKRGLGPWMEVASE